MEPVTSDMPIPAIARETSVPAPWWQRLLAGGVCVAAATLLGVAAWLEPNTAGVGTHTQLGMNACAFHVAHGLPCATCGMTTSFALMADGRMLAGFLTQPAGAMLALLTACTIWVTGWAAVRGTDLSRLLLTLVTPRTLAVVGVLGLLSWGYKLLLAAT